MKPAQLISFLISMVITVMIGQSNLQARDSSEIMSMDTTPPVMTPTDTLPPAQPAATTTAEKEKKEGFNSKTRFGIRGGGVISKQDYESSNTLSEDTEGKIGADLGIVVTIPIVGGFLAVQPELHWVQKGYKANSKSTGEQVTTNLDYFEIPVLARFNFGGSLRLFAFAGPCFGWVLDGSYDPDNGLDPTDYLKETETSGHVGIGVGIGTFEFDIRYMAGLSDVSNGEEFKDAKNSSYGAGITLKF
ncbi:MAG TPA: porin family protein [Saprospiraceae bacterium]|nr:porin family protein [Saprospiraceae bacterium]